MWGSPTAEVVILAALLMAPGSVSGDSSSSSPSPSPSTAGSSGPHGSGKPSLRCSGVVVARRHPTVLHMVLEALQAGEQRRGTSVAAIKLYILHKYPTVDATRFKYLLKQALATGMRRGLLTRPFNSKARGATGSFKLVPKHKKKPPASKKRPQMEPASSSKKGAAEPGEPRVLPRPAKALEKAPQGGCKAKNTRPQQDAAKKGPPKPSGAASSVHRPGRKPKVAGSQGRQGDAGPPGKTVAVAPKARKRATSPTDEKPTMKATSGTGPKATAGPKATTAPKVRGPKGAMLSSARRAGSPCKLKPVVKSSSSEPRS